MKILVDFLLLSLTDLFSYIHLVIYFIHLPHYLFQLLHFAYQVFPLGSFLSDFVIFLQTANMFIYFLKFILNLGPSDRIALFPWFFPPTPTPRPPPQRSNEMKGMLQVH